MKSIATVARSEGSVVKDRVSKSEWNARVELAALYRAVAKLGMTDWIYNHITLRVPGEPNHFLVNSFGMLYEEVTASSLYKVDFDGNVVLKPDNEFELNQAALVIHSAVHKARHDVNCVLHTHTRASMAVSAMKCGLLPITQHATMFDGRLSYFDFNGPVIDLSEQAKLVAALGSNKVALMRNHGTLACGATVAETFFNIYYLEMACKAQVDAMSVGYDQLIIPSPEVMANTRRIYMSADAGGFLSGELDWKAMLRALDNAGADYRN